MEKIVKTILAVLLLLCLLGMPYGFYMFVRFMALVGFSVLAYFAYKENKLSEIAIYITLAILFQPLIKIALGRTLWNIVDVIVAIGLLISLSIKCRNEDKR